MAPPIRKSKKDKYIELLKWIDETNDYHADDAIRRFEAYWESIQSQYEIPEGPPLDINDID